MSKFIELTTGRDEKFLINVESIEQICKLDKDWASGYAVHREFFNDITSVVYTTPHIDLDNTQYVVETYDQIKTMLM